MVVVVGSGAIAVCFGAVAVVGTRGGGGGCDEVGGSYGVTIFVVIFAVSVAFETTPHPPPPPSAPPSHLSDSAKR